MSKIFKNLIPYWRWIILIFVFLIAQAYCDLALPAYTSDIIDVGIQDHGIEHILPKEITSEDYQMAQTFMLSDEKENLRTVMRQRMLQNLMTVWQNTS